MKKLINMSKEELIDIIYNISIGNRLWRCQKCGEFQTLDYSCWKCGSQPPADAEVEIE